MSDLIITGYVWGGTVVQCLLLLPHTTKVLGSNQIDIERENSHSCIIKIGKLSYLEVRIFKVHFFGLS